jgi:DNA-directed RNA polymerase specialized sigma24 family protein
VEKLFAEHRRALQAYFYRRIRTKSDAPDLAQEVYVRMLRVSEARLSRSRFAAFWLSGPQRK